MPATRQPGASATRDEQPVEAVLEASRAARPRLARGPAAYSSGGEQVEGRVGLRADDVERPLARRRSLLTERARSATVGEARARRARLAARRRSGSARRRSPAPTGSTARTRRSSKLAGSSVAITSRPAGLQDARRLGESARPRSTRWSAIRITTASNQPCLNGKRLGSADSRVDAELPWPAATISAEASTAQTRASSRSASASREPAGAASDLEHAGAAQLTEPHERVEDLPPVVVDGPELLVAGRARRRSPLGCPRSIASRSRRRASRLAWSLRSRPALDERRLAALAERHLDRRRSRAGRTVAGKISRASRRSSGRSSAVRRA